MKIKWQNCRNLALICEFWLLIKWGGEGGGGLGANLYFVLNVVPRNLGNLIGLLCIIFL